MNQRDKLTLGAGLGGFGCAGMIVLLALAAFLVSNSAGGCTPGGVVIAEPGVGAMIVHESSDDSKLSTTQLDAMKSTADDSLRAYVKSKDGIFVMLDKDDPIDKERPVVKEVWKLKRDSLPWLYVWKNRSAVGKPLGDDALKTVKDKLR